MSIANDNPVPQTQQRVRRTSHGRNMNRVPLWRGVKTPTQSSAPPRPCHWVSLWAPHRGISIAALVNKESGYAREEDIGESQASKTPREISEHTGRRIRARRDASHQTRQTRRPLDQTSDRHRTFESAARRRPSLSSKEGNRFGKDAAFRRAGLQAGRARAEAVRPPFASQCAGARARRPKRGIERGTF